MTSRCLEIHKGVSQDYVLSHILCAMLSELIFEIAQDNEGVKVNGGDISNLTARLDIVLTAKTDVGLQLITSLSCGFH